MKKKEHIEYEICRYQHMHIVKTTHFGHISFCIRHEYRIPSNKRPRCYSILKLKDAALTGERRLIEGDMKFQNFVFSFSK